MISLWQEIHERMMQLDEEAQEAFELGKAAAEAEREYRAALANEMLSLREKKIPATLIPDIARGRLAEQKKKRDCAQAEYKAQQEVINVHKINVRMLNDQYEREWHSGN